MTFVEYPKEASSFDFIEDDGPRKRTSCPLASRRKRDRVAPCAAKATLIYRRTGNLRAVQLFLGHTKIESTVRYLGIEVDDALAIAEQAEV